MKTEPLLSFIIPVLNEGPALARNLGELRRAFAEAEIIVVDGGSADDSCAQAQPYCDQLLNTAPGRALQMNAGAALARGRVLAFLHCDTRMTCTADAFSKVLAAGPGWGFFRVRLDGPDVRLRVVEWFMNQRSRLTRVATGDQLLFVEAQLFRRVGGFPSIALMEDVAMSKRLRRQARPTIVAAPVLTSARRWQHHGFWRTVFTMWRLRLAYWLGADPQRLARSYYGR